MTEIGPLARPRVATPGRSVVDPKDPFDEFPDNLSTGPRSMRLDRRRFLPLILIALAATPAGRLVAQDAPPTYTNPVWAKDFPDPFVLAVGGKYYAYATQTRGTGFQLMESTDLVHWDYKILDFPIPWSDEHYWAPEAVARNGKFYLTYSALDPKMRKHHIAVATADKPTGPFQHHDLLVRGDDNEVGVIDATHFFEPDGSAFLVYSEETPRRIVMRRAAPDLLSVQGEAAELIRPDLDWERGVVEAPSIVLRDGVYHLFYSAGPYEGTKVGGRYAVGHATAKALKGPYTKSPKPILESVEGATYGPGHQCIIHTPDGGWWMMYHAWDAVGQPRYGQNPSGRTMRLDRIEWTGDEPKVVGPTLTPQLAPLAAPVPARAPAGR